MSAFCFGYVPAFWPEHDEDEARALLVQHYASVLALDKLEPVMMALACGKLSLNRLALLQRADVSGGLRRISRGCAGLNRV